MYVSGAVAIVNFSTFFVTNINLDHGLSTTLYKQGRRQGKSLEGANSSGVQGTPPGGGPGGGAPWWGSGAKPPEADTFLMLKSW